MSTECPANVHPTPSGEAGRETRGDGSLRRSNRRAVIRHRRAFYSRVFTSGSLRTPRTDGSDAQHRLDLPRSGGPIRHRPSAGERPSVSSLQVPPAAASAGAALVGPSTTLSLSPTDQVVETLPPFFYRLRLVTTCRVFTLFRLVAIHRHRVFRLIFLSLSLCALRLFVSLF